MSPEEPIAVVGLGCVFPGAADVDSYWANIAAGRNAIDAVPPDRIDERLLAAVVPGEASRRGGFLPSDALLFNPARFGIMPVAVDAAEPDQLVALRIAAAALDDFGGLADVAHERVGVILGRGSYLNPGVARLEQRVRTAGQLVACLRTLLPGLGDDRLAEIHTAFCSELGVSGAEGAIGLVPNLAASRIANRLDLGGPAFTIDAACASSLVAVDAALGELRARRCDLVLAGGIHHCHDVTLWAVFSQLGALSPTGALRPFGRHADGILIGEGTGVVVLERLADATRLGHDVYATILGSGVSSDGRDASLMSPRTDGQVLALQRAYAAASVDPAEVELLEGHGTATAAGDQAELETIRRVFGKRGNGAADGFLGSVKSLIGHAMPAAGVAGLIKAVLAIHHGVLPPASEADDPQPLLNETRFQLLREAVPWSAPLSRRLAGVNAFGFGGINAHLVVSGRGASGRRSSRAGGAAPGGWAAPSPEPNRDVILLAGADASELAAQLAGLHPGVDRDMMPARPGPARLAIVDPTPRRVEMALRALERARPWRGRNDIWFEPEGLLATGGRLAFVFPGVEPNFESDRLGLARGFGRTTLPVPEGSAPLERQAWEIFDLGRLLYDILGDLGVHPDDVAGHSLGEWTGVFAVEMIDQEQAPRFLAGLKPGALELPGVVYLALGCGVDVATELVAGIAGFTLSHDNCPHQSMVCGPPEGAPEVLNRARGRQVLAQELPFRSGFHSPAFEPHLERVHHHWARMRLQKPSVPMWSATTCSPYPDDPDEVRALAATHLLEAVRFRELTLNLYEHGCRVFVQLGVGSLVNFVEDTLRGRPHLAIAGQVGKRSGMAQLARVAAALWVEGARVDLSRLLTPARAGADRATGPSVRLRLGVPLVELPAHLTVAPVSAPTNGGLREAERLDSPLALAHDALVSEAVAASSAVLDALATRPPVQARPPVPPTRSPVRPPVQPAPGPRHRGPAPLSPVLRETLTVSLTEQPWLRDHEFYRQPPGWPDDSDRFPLVPMTTMLEMFADAATRLVPGRTVVRIESVRAYRWLQAAPPKDVELVASAVTPDRVEVALEGYAKATVVLADGPVEAPHPSLEPLSSPGPSPLDPDGLYRQHFMFHGPAFQGLRHFAALGDNGIDGELEALPSPGATLDNAGQLYGWWVMTRVDRDQLALPQAIERVELFQSLPPGTRVPTRVRIRAMDERTVRADIELLRDARVAIRVTGWVDLRFDSDPPLFAMLRDPERHLLATILPGGAAIVDERWPHAASRELIARRYLTVSERAEYESLNPRAQRARILGRVAAKDAARAALWAEGHGHLFPHEIGIGNDDRGAPVVTGELARGRPLSIAHRDTVGVALVGEPGGPPVGIDVERIEPRSEGSVSAFLSPAEKALISDAFSDVPPDEGITIAWAAKEAAAKATGRGLEGRPKDYPITAIDGPRLHVCGRWVSSIAVDAPVQDTGIPATSAPSSAQKDFESRRYVIAWTDA